MGSESGHKPQAQAINLVVSNKALKLAESWVSDMSSSTMCQAKDVEFEGRPPRLGVGAKPLKRTSLAVSSNPVERTLLKKIGIGHGKLLTRMQELKDVSNVDEDNADSDDELESRANAFKKKKASPITISTYPKMYKNDNTFN